MKVVMGLGNKGEEYEKTRHNTGRIILSFIKDKVDPDLKVKFFMPDTFMNISGKHALSVVKNKKDLKDFIVVYDDVDLPLGKIKISFNRSSGGHNGLGSIIKALKSEEFLRIRVGISPATPTGKIRKPKGEKKVLDFLLSDFKKTELEELKKVSKTVKEVIEMIYNEGYQKAMSIYN